MNSEYKIDKAKMDHSVEVEKPTLALKLFGKLVDFSEALNIRQSRLGSPPVYSNALFPWAKELEAEWQAIRRELDAVLVRREELPNFQDIAADVAAIQNDNHWKTFFLYGYGVPLEENCRRCPETTRLLQKIPGMKTAFFSILSPRKHIPAHRGPFNGVLRYHLGLKVPKDRESCRIRILDKYYTWEEGKSLIFDDSYNHEVWNDTDEIRVVLFVDFMRPLYFPANLLNHSIVKMATWSPFIKGAKDRHEKWEKDFYSKEKKS